MTRVVGILAGGGSLPREIAHSILTSGHHVVIVAIEGEGDASEFGTLEVTFVNWGQVGRIIRIFKEKHVQDILVIGSVRRPNLLNFRTDLGFYKNLFLLFKLIKAGGDDGVLRSVIRVIEKRGFRVLGPKDLAPDLIVSEGPIGDIKVPSFIEADIKFGFDVLRRLAPFDIGQSCVIHNGKLLAIEAAEGTDTMLKRVSQMPKTGFANGILIKGPKPGQELRIDMPTIGPKTIDNVALAGLSGIIVQSGMTLAAQRSTLLKKANELRIFVAGVTLSSENFSAPQTVSIYKIKDDRDIACDVLRALGKDVNSLGVIVIRRHIIAVETGEGLDHVLQRTAQLPQWGGWKFRRRGVLAVTEEARVSSDHIRLAARLGLAHIIQISSHNSLSENQRALRAQAKKTGIEYSLRTSF